MIKLKMRIALLATLLLLSVTTSSAQSSNSCGLMVMAHGGAEKWNAAVEDAVAPVREKIPTSIAFGMANPETMKAAIAKLEEQNIDCIAVVRLFMSAHSFLHQTEYLLGLREDPPPFFISHRGPQHHHEPPTPVEFQGKIAISQTALLDASEMGEVLAMNARALSDSSGNESVLIIAHGAGDDAVNDEWLLKLDRLSDTVREIGLFRSVAVHSLREDWKEKRSKSEVDIRGFVEEHTEGDGRVIVLPFRLFGFGPYAEVLEGLTYESNGIGLLPHPKVSTWIERTANELFVELSQDTDA
ncbi:MAG: hypothetical protein OXH01_10790 [Bacteroidetes bacterium]|nr:hypothetical protein [Bacteroidota bacterium]